MADILTNLRELSVGVYFFYPDSIETITPEKFANICKANIQFFNSTTNISESSTFNELELNTIKNGFDLGKKIQENLNISLNNLSIAWKGNEKDDLIDLQINNYMFSLKERSFILKNMGLYNLLNILTNTEQFKRGLHIFKQFAPEQFEIWFKTALKCIKKSKKFNYISEHGYESYGEIQGDNLILCLNDTSITISNFLDITYDDFEKQTNSDIREKVFCKWVAEASDDNYYNKKRECAEVAGANLQEYINNNLVSQSPSILQLFNLEQNEYIYAKNDGQNIQISKVPGLKTVDYRNWIVEKVEVSVPNSQLNLKTTVKNLENGKTCTFRNEIRYSHGQFNGTPEAKLYIESDDNLEDIIYISLI
jgi:hypothetical protein